MPGLDLTDFSQVPVSYYQPKPTQQAQNKPKMEELQEVEEKIFAPIDEGLIDPEMRESLDREARQPEGMKKHFWGINKFESYAFNEETIAAERKRRGIPEPDEAQK